MSRPAVFVTESLPAEAKEILSGFEVFESSADDEALARCQALICWPSRAKRELLSKMKGLKMVQTMSAGVDALDFGSLQSDVQVFSNAGAYTENVAEHAWGMLLGAAKGIHVRNLRSTPRKLREKTILVLGCGSIGSEVARLAKSLDMKTVGVSRSFKSPELFDERYGIEALPDVIGSADAIICSLPLTRSTRGLLDYPMLMKAKGTVVFSNVGRGEVISEEGLLKWLKERPESRYATDVFWIKDGKEYFATDAWELPNFAGSLHNSGLPFGEDLSGAKVAAARNVRRYFEAGSALNRVDRTEYF